MGWATGRGGDGNIWSSNGGRVVWAVTRTSRDVPSPIGGRKTRLEDFFLPHLLVFKINAKYYVRCRLSQTLAQPRPYLHHSRWQRAPPLQPCRAAAGPGEGRERWSEQLPARSRAVGCGGRGQQQVRVLELPEFGSSNGHLR